LEAGEHAGGRMDDYRVPAQRKHPAPPLAVSLSADGRLPAMRQQLPNPVVGLRRQQFESIFQMGKGIVAVQ